MTPKPVRREPGSSPRIRTFTAGTGRGLALAVRGTEAPTLRVLPGNALTSRARHDLVRYLDICVNVLYVFKVFEGFDQMQHCYRRLPRERDRNRSALGHFRAGGDKPRGLQRRAHGLEFDWIGQYFQRSWYHVLRARLQGDRCHSRGIGSGRKFQLPHLVEQIAHRAPCAQVPTVRAHDLTHLRNRALTIVSTALDDERRATGTVRLA